MLKKIIALSLSVLMLTSLAACGGDTGFNSSEKESQPAISESGDPPMSKGTNADVPEGEESIIKLAISTGNRMEWAQTVGDAYMAENPGTKIEYIEIVSGSDMYTKITMMMQSGQTSPDIITEDGFMIHSDAAAGYLEPLDDYLMDWEDLSLFESAILDGGKGEDGKQYGIPMSTDVQGIWYDKNLMEAAGVAVPFEPKTWDDVMGAAKKIKETSPDDVIPLFLFASKVAPEETSMRTFQELYFGTGAELYNFEEKKWIVDKENLIKVFNFVNDVYNVEQVGPPLSIASQQNVGDLFQSDYFKNQKLGMFFSGNWEAGNWGEGKQYEWAEGLDNIAFTKIPTYDGAAPGYSTMSGGWTWAVPANASNKEGGVDFLKFISNKENSIGFAIMSGDLAVRSDVMSDDTYLNQPMSVVEECNEFLQYAHFRPSVEGYSSLTIMFTEVIESIAMGSSSPEEAVETFEREMIRLVGKENVLVK